MTLRTLSRRLVLALALGVASTAAAGLPALADTKIKMVLNWQDDEHDPEKSVNAYNTLRDWGLQILVGTTTTNPCVAVSALTNADRIFELTPSASSVNRTRRRRPRKGEATSADGGDCPAAEARKERFRWASRPRPNQG